MKLRDLAVMVAIALVAIAVFYLFSPKLLTWLYAAASLATGLLLLCMLQTDMVDSSTEFRWAVVVMATGCIAVVLAPFIQGFEVGPPGVVRALGELAVVALMRWRQLQAAGFRASCLAKVRQTG